MDGYLGLTSEQPRRNPRLQGGVLFVISLPQGRWLWWQGFWRIGTWSYVESRMVIITGKGEHTRTPGAPLRHNNWIPPGAFAEDGRPSFLPR